MISSTNSEYAIASDREIAAVIGKFSPEIFLLTLNNILEDRERGENYLQIGNLVSAYEANYKMIQNTYPDNIDSILEMRQATYETVINKLCDHFQLTLNITPDMDVYSIAFFLYRFLISDFQQNVITFFTNFILREQRELYQSFDLENLKKTKDSASIYTSKLMNGEGNDKLAAIHSDLDPILTGISSHDIDITQIISLIYQGDPYTTSFLGSIVQDNGDFYKNFIVPVLHGPHRSTIITYVRLQLNPYIIPNSSALAAMNIAE